MCLYIMLCLYTCTCVGFSSSRICRQLLENGSTPPTSALVIVILMLNATWAKTFAPYRKFDTFYSCFLIVSVFWSLLKVGFVTSGDHTIKLAIKQYIMFIDIME